MYRRAAIGKNKLNRCQIHLSSTTMIKITTTALVIAATLAAPSLFAGDHACCAKGAAIPHSMACVNLTSLNLTTDQKNKIEAWQSECMKAGCTKESRQMFLTRAKQFFPRSSSLS